MISSIQSIQNAVAAGRSRRIDWNKNMLPTTAAVAGETSFLAKGAGNPPTSGIYNTGTNLTFQPVSDSTSDSGSIQHGGSVAPYHKQLISGTAFSAAATTAPNTLILVDLIGFYRVTTVTSALSQALTNTFAQSNAMTAVDAAGDYIDHTAYNLLTGTRVQLTTSGTLPGGLATATDYYLIRVNDTRCQFATTYANAIAGTPINITDTGSGTHNITWLLPRWTNGDGVQAFLWNTNTTAMGAATPSLSFPSYTNNSQDSGRATPATLPIGKTAAANGLVLYSGTGSGKYPMFMPLQGADGGIAQVNNVQLSTSYVSGEFSIGLCRPLAEIPITTLGVPGEREWVAMAPRIYDGANLHFLMYHGANTPTNSAIAGSLNVVWTPA